MLTYPWCDHCVRHNICRKEEPLEKVVKKMGDVVNLMEASFFRFNIECKDYKEKKYDH